MAMSKTVFMLMKQTTYLISRSRNGKGVSQAYIKKYRNRVIDILGQRSFDYLDLHLDSRNGYWQVSGSFTWSRMYSKRAVIIPGAIDKAIYRKYEGEILGAIDKALGGSWWGSLSDKTQERIHGELSQVLKL